VKEVSDNEGYEAESHVAPMILQKTERRHLAKQKTILLMQVMKQHSYPWTM